MPLIKMTIPLALVAFSVLLPFQNCSRTKKDKIAEEGSKLKLSYNETNQIKLKTNLLVSYLKFPAILRISLTGEQDNVYSSCPLHLVDEPCQSPTEVSNIDSDKSEFSYWYKINIIKNYNDHTLLDLREKNIGFDTYAIGCNEFDLEQASKHCIMRFEVRWAPDCNGDQIHSPNEACSKPDFLIVIRILVSSEESEPYILDQFTRQEVITYSEYIEEVKAY